MLKISKAHLSDSDLLKSLMLEALKADPNAFSVTHEEYARGSKEWWQEFLSPYLFGLEKEMFIGRYAGTPVALSGLVYNRREKSSHVASLVWVYCNNDYRGKGIGKGVIQFAINAAKKREDIEKITLTVTESQLPAISIYKSLGFEESGFQKNHLKTSDSSVGIYTLELHL